MTTLKKYSGALVSLVMLALLFVQCDKIEGPVYEQQTSTVDTTCTFDVDNSPVNKKVLLEDYTGFTCGNCPEAGIYLNDTLAPNYGDNLVVISVHANFFAIPCGVAGGACPTGRPPGSFENDYRCPVGEAWYSFFNIFSNPLGLIDRAGYPSPSMYQQWPQWAGKINNELALAPEARLRMKNTYDAGTRKVRTCIESKILNAVTDTFKLQVVLLEDSITDWQLWYGHIPEHVPDYLHRHVLRTEVNGSFGTTIASGVITAGTTVVTGYNFTLNPTWDENHCIVVAFIYDAGNYRVLQVEEAKVIE